VKRKQDRRPEEEMPPHCPDSERSVIGSIWIDTTLMDSIAELLKPDDFYLPDTSRVYAEMLAMRRDGVPIDTTLLMGRLKDAGALKDDADSLVTIISLAEMADSTPTAANGMWYAEKVARKAEQRRAWLIGQKLMRMGLDDYNAAENYATWRSEIEASPGVVFRPIVGRPDVGISTAAELMTETLPEPKWAIPDLLPEGLAILAGKPKFGKSWLMLAISNAVASGGFALGKLPVQQGSVLYLGLEDSKRRLQNRLGIMLCGEPAPAKFHYSLTWQRTDEGGVDRIRRWLEKQNDARLIVVDTLKKIRPKRQRNGNAYDEDYEAAMPLKALADEFGVCVACVTHTRKQKSDDVIDEVSGTLGLAACADSIIVAKRDRGRFDGTLFITGRDIEERELSLSWNPELCLWSYAGDGQEQAVGRERQAIIDALAAAVPHWPGPSEIADKLGKTSEKERATIRKLMSLMACEGQIKAMGRGQYTVIHNVHNVHGGDSHVHIPNPNVNEGESCTHCESHTPCE
jgi:replicative DNA helicase